MTGSTGWVMAVALGRLGEREVIATGGVDSTVRIWDTHRQSTIVLDLFKPVIASAISSSDRLCVATVTAVSLS